MTRARTAIAALTVAIMIGPGVAIAGDTIPSEVDVLGGENVQEGDLVYGQVISEKRKCQANRKLKLLIDPLSRKAPKRGSGFDVIDRTRSSDPGGGWAVVGDFSEAFRAKIKMEPRRLPNGAVCSGDSTPLAT